MSATATAGIGAVSKLSQTRVSDRPGGVAHAFSVLCRAFQPDISESIVNSFPGQSAGPTEGRDFDSPLWPQSVETIVAAAQQTPSTNPYTTQKDLDAGARLYRPLCAGCHGFDARGAAGEGPDIQVGSPGRRRTRRSTRPSGMASGEHPCRGGISARPCVRLIAMNSNKGRSAPHIIVKGPFALTRTDEVALIQVFRHKPSYFPAQNTRSARGGDCFHQFRAFKESTTYGRIRTRNWLTVPSITQFLLFAPESS